MSYPTGGSGYNAPATPPAPSSSGQSAGTGTESTAKGLPYFLVVGVAALGVINFLLGFLPFFGGESQSRRSGDGDTLSLFQYFGGAALLAILLFGGLLAGLSLLPKQNWTGAAAAASAAGFLGTLFLAFTTSGDLLKVELKWGAYLLLFLAFVQTAVAVAAVLFESGILTPPAPKPATPQGPPSGFGAGGYGQQGAFGQSQPAAFGQSPSPYGQSQPGQSYGQPGYGSQTGPQYQSQQPYGQSQPSQPSYGQSQQPPYGQQPSYGQQPGYGAAQQGSPYGATPAAQPRPDENATQHFGAQQQPGQQYGAPGFGQGQPGQQNQPFGGETGSDPSSDATHAFRPSEDNK